MKRVWLLGMVMLLALAGCAPAPQGTPTLTVTATAECRTYPSAEAAQAVAPFAIVVVIGEDAGTLERAEVCAPPYDVTLTYRLADGATLIARSWSPEGMYELPADPLMEAVTVQGEDGWKGEVIPGMRGLLWEKGDGVIYALVSPDLELDALLQLRIQPGFIQ